MARAVLARRLMHAIFFGLKRAFHRTLAVARPMLRPFGLTPARFDMLYAIHGIHLPDCHFATQRSLRDRLGVSAPTISRMLKSLEELGLVTRRRCEGDTRQRMVSLTEKGVEWLESAMRECIDSGRAQLTVDCGVSKEPTSDHVSLLDGDHLETILYRIRHNYWDVASLHYPWHPDD
jgi:DNA-binding MarR family transcriptional regulator